MTSIRIQWESSKSMETSRSDPIDRFRFPFSSQRRMAIHFHHADISSSLSMKIMLDLSQRNYCSTIFWEQVTLCSIWLTNVVEPLLKSIMYRTIVFPLRLVDWFLIRKQISLVSMVQECSKQFYCDQIIQPSTTWYLSLDTTGSYRLQWFPLL